MSPDSEVLQQAVHWLKQGHCVYLVTVARSWGSAPRPPGSLAALRGDGTIAGSVSGGCVEDDLCQRIVKGDLKPVSPQKETYGVTREQAHRFGLPCGGVLELVIEPLEHDSNLSRLMEVIDERRLIMRRVDLRTGEVSLHNVCDKFEFSYDGNRLEKIYGPAWRLLIIGAGQLSDYLARMALMLDYHVMICDPRAEYIMDFLPPDVEVISDMPDDAVRKLEADRRTAIVALTHDPRLDDMALLEALSSNAFYVGVIGSQSNNSKRRQRLASFNLSSKQLSQLHGPVGLPIGSRTPAEIAISILAEITSLRRGVQVNKPESKRSHSTAVFG